ncbi:MAG: mannosyltransferase family protein [Propionibacteriaceae bacterium]
MSPARTDRDGPRLVVQAWLGSRLLLAIVFGWVLWSTGRAWRDTIGNWDVAHFLRIARDGYAARNEAAFFPGFPLVLRAASTVGLDMTIVGIVISLVGSAFAAWALWRLGGPRVGVVAAALWLFAPTAVFTVVPYTESLFSALAFWAWVRARDGRWGWAALLAAGACSVRVSGVFLLAALGVLALTATYEGDRRWLQRLKAVGWVLVPAAVPLAYATYLRITKGSWLAWYQAQASGWSRGLTWPWDSFAHTLPAIVPGAYANHPGWAAVFRFEVVSVVVGIVVTIVCLVLKRWAEATWVGLQVMAFTTSYWFMSVNRAALLWFPLWLLLGSFATRPGRTRTARVVVVLAWAAASALLLVWWAARFFTGQWAS